MYKRIDIILKKIENIEDILSKCNSISEALKDELLYRPAIMMHLIGIAEQFKKLQDDVDIETLSKFDKSDIRGALALRNFIAHDYEGVNLAIVENVLREYLPKIKKSILEIKNGC